MKNGQLTEGGEVGNSGRMQCVATMNAGSSRTTLSTRVVAVQKGFAQVASLARDLDAQ